MLTGQALIADINSCQLSPGQCAFWWLGQHGFAIKLGKTVIYLDAFLAPLRGRNVAPLLAPEEVTNAAVILGTHDHIDHIDRKSWPGMAKGSPAAKFIVPKLVRDAVVRDLALTDANVIGLDDGQSVQVGDLKISAIPAAHELLDQDSATGMYPYLGYIVEGNGVCLYHAGDSCIYEGIQARLRRWKLDLAFLPINGRDAKRLAGNCIGNMTYQEAVDLAGTIKPGLTIPTHFEMFSGNSENPQNFMDYIKVKYPNLKAQVPQHGQRTIVDAARS
jgi:L-ascorbate metabolism protein UlaG (beta-lactamase superfamily)